MQGKWQDFKDTGEVDQNISERKRKEKEEEKKNEEKMIKMQSHGIDVMWNMTVYDVEKTLRAACGRIFRDRTDHKDLSKARARGLLKLGEIM